MLKLPYAIRDFNQLISQDDVYLDRTDRIAVMEAVGIALPASPSFWEEPMALHLDELL